MAPGSLLSDVFIAAQEVNQLLKLGLDGAPLTPTEYAVYSFILEHPDLTPTALSVGLGMPLQTLSDWLSVLRQRGHLRTAASPVDRRSYSVTLSQTGKRAQRATMHKFDRANNAFLALLDVPEDEAREALASLINASASARQILRGVKTA